MKWLRPDTKQFYIYWDMNKEHLYEPDFVVETENIIYMIETKSKKMNRAKYNPKDEISLKASASLGYCKKVFEFNLNNGGKEWIHVHTPHDVVEKENNSFDYLVKSFGYKEIINK